MTRAEQFARKLYTPWSEDGMSRKDNTEVIEACIKGYEQAEKDYIELAQLWLDSGYVNIMSFKQFLKCHETQSNK